MKSSLKPLLAILLSALLLSGCTFKATNYRLTIEVEDNGVVHTGTGVWRYETIRGWSETFKGQAIPVDVGTKGTIYVLLAERTPEGDHTGNMYYIGRLFNQAGIERRVGASVPIDCEASKRGGGTSCPFMVRFKDERDPATVEAVDPNNLSASFGSGVKLRSINVTITKDGVTKGLVKRLPWMRGLGGRIVPIPDGPMSADVNIRGRLRHNLNAYVFSEGISQ